MAGEQSIQIGALDGVRALTAFTVLVSHCLILTGWPPVLPLVPHAGQAAKMAVDVFMLLSGFLMVHTTREQQAVGGWGTFYVRRFFRIAPVYYFCLAGTFVFLAPLLDHYAVIARLLGWSERFEWIDYSATSLALHFSFLFGLVPAHAANTTLPDWSLGLEMQFYAAFPLLIVLMRRYGPIRVSVAFLAIFYLASSLWAPLFREPSFLLLKLPVFSAGMLLCLAADAARARRLALTAAGIAFTLTQYDRFGVDVLWVAASAGVIALVTQPAGLVAPMQRFAQRILDNRLMRFGAAISYSVYLLHGSVIALVVGTLFPVPSFAALDPHIRTALATLAIIPLTIAVSTCVHYAIEKPGIALGRMLTRNKRKLAAAGA